MEAGHGTGAGLPHYNRHRLGDLLAAAAHCVIEAVGTQESMMQAIRAARPCGHAGYWFTGNVAINPIASGHAPNRLTLGNVHFSPGARTAWHSHSIAQTLYVTEGEGLVQARGEAVIRIRPGDVVSIAGEEWHWHGATPEHFMTHLALTEGDTTWGEHVTDTEYQAS